MNNSDERDYAEEAANQALPIEGDDDDDMAPSVTGDPLEVEPSEGDPLEGDDGDE